MKKHVLLAAAVICSLAGSVYADPVFLLGVIATGNPETSVAVFGVDHSEHRRLGETIGGYTLTEIGSRSVTLIRDAERLVLLTGDRLSAEGAVQITTGLERRRDELLVSEQLRDHVAGEGLLSILMQAGTEPVVDITGAVIGYRLFEIDPGSVYDLAGLKDDDIVVEVDGVPVDSPVAILRVLAGLKTKPDFTFAVSRGAELLRTRVVVR